MTADKEPDEDPWASLKLASDRSHLKPGGAGTLIATVILAGIGGAVAACFLSFIVLGRASAIGTRVAESGHLLAMWLLASAAIGATIAVAGVFRFWTGD